MAIRVELEQDLVLIVFTGKVTRAEFCELLRRLDPKDPVTAHRHRLVDLTDMEAFEPGFNEMHQFAEVRAIAEYVHPVRLALHAPRAMHYGIARMYQNLMRNPNIQVQVFRELPAARAWALTGEDREGATPAE